MITPNQPSRPSRPTRPTRSSKMFCKVCNSAGKPDSVCKTHNVRDEKGSVICTTLLSQSCKYCKEKGHTPKYCTKLKIKQKNQQQQQQQAPRNSNQQRARELCSSPPPASAPIGKKTNNYFQTLMVDEETGEPTKDTEIETYTQNLKNNFPALGQEKTMKIVNAIFTTRGQSYSSAANSTAPASARYERDDSPTPSPISSRPHSPPPAPKKMPRVKEEENSEPSLGTPSPPPTQAAPMTTRWADME